MMKRKRDYLRLNFLIVLTYVNKINSTPLVSCCWTGRFIHALNTLLMCTQCKRILKTDGIKPYRIFNRHIYKIFICRIIHIYT